MYIHIYIYRYTSVYVYNCKHIFVYICTILCTGTFAVQNSVREACSISKSRKYLSGSRVSLHLCAEVYVYICVCVYRSIQTYLYAYAC